MSKFEEIKSAISALPADELARLRAWLDELAEQRFDAAIERDAADGKLDNLIEQALADHRSGRTSEL